MKKYKFKRRILEGNEKLILSHLKNNTNTCTQLRFQIVWTRNRERGWNWGGVAGGGWVIDMRVGDTLD